MQSNVSAAKPYAKAAFQYACEHDDLVGWCEFLKASALLVNQEQISDWLSAPVTQEDRFLIWNKLLLVQLSQESLNQGKLNFIKQLIEKKRLSLSAAILFEFTTLKEQYEKLCRVVLRSVKPLSDKNAEKFESALSKKLGLSVTVQQEQDPSLIAGAVIEAGDLVFDFSIHGKLKQLAEGLL